MATGSLSCEGLSTFLTPRLAADDVAPHLTKVTGVEDLPVELLLEIFSCLVASDNAQAALVSHVCGQWRAAALNAPSLWSMLVLCGDHIVEKTQTWIYRSNGHIRELRVDHLPNNQLDPCITALQMIQWDHIRVCRIHAVITHPIMVCLQGKGMLHVISNLDEFEILSDDRVYARVAMPFLHRLKRSNLRSLTVHGILVEEAVPGPKLETLVLSDVVLRHMALYNLVAANPMLQRIVASCRIENAFAPANATLSLSRLTHLDISYQTVVFFCRVPLPSLQVLRISHAMGDAAISFLDGLLRNPSMLTELTIVDSRVSSVPFFQCLQAATSLRSLQLSEVGPATMGCTLLAMAVRPFMCPLLSRIHFSPADVPAHAVKRLVESRLPVVPGPGRVGAAVQIDTLVLNDCLNIDAETLSWLGAHVQNFSCSQWDGHRDGDRLDDWTGRLHDRSPSMPFRSDRRIPLLHNYTVLPGSSAPRAIPSRAKKAAVIGTPKP